MTARRVLPWVAVGAAVVLLGVVLALLVRPEPAPPTWLSASNPEPDGAMAVAEVLRSRGVEVIETESLADTEDAARIREATTVVVVDPEGILDGGQHDRLLGVARRLVVVEPWGSAVGDLAPGVTEEGIINGRFDADCPVPAVQKAGSVVASASAYRLRTSADGTACLTVAGDLSALVQVDTAGTTVTVLGAGDALTNGQVTTAGNAALALNLLGASETLIWYLPGDADFFEQSGDTLADLQATWTLPLILLLGLVAFAAAFWRGRRFGPLVLENLPVVVRARETMEGRARLYERASTRLHALDALRIGTIGRLAARCGLPRSASVAEVVDAVAELTGSDRAGVGDVLVDAVPANDRELMRLSDALADLERRADAATRPL